MDKQVCKCGRPATESMRRFDRSVLCVTCRESERLLSMERLANMRMLQGLSYVALFERKIR